MSDITYYSCPQCGNVYSGQGSLGADWVCICGCRISAEFVDKIRRYKMLGRAFVLGCFLGLLCAYCSIHWGFRKLGLSPSYGQITLIFIPIWVFLIYNLSKKRKNHTINLYILYPLLVIDMLGFLHIFIRYLFIGFFPF